MPYPAPHRPRLRPAAILPVLIVAVVFGCASHVLLTASVSTPERFINVFMQQAEMNRDKRQERRDDPSWPRSARPIPADWPPQVTWTSEWTEWTFSHKHASALSVGEVFSVEVIRVGIPWRTAEMINQTHGALTIVSAVPPPPTYVGSDEVMRLSTFRSRLHLLLDPTRILWPGFIANTLIFAAAYLAIFAAFRQTRRSLRRRRNLCPDCAYSRADLSPETPCPECGRVLSPTRVT